MLYSEAIYRGRTTVDTLAGDRTARLVFRALIGCAVAVAGVTFTLSFVGLRDYGMRLMGLPAWLAPLVPIGVDVFSLCGCAATYLLRHGPFRIRAYAWAVFLFPSALSVSGNLAHADAKRLPDSGRVGAAVAPVLLALAVHLVIVARRWYLGDSDQATACDSETPSAGETPTQASTPETPSAGETSATADRRPHNATPDDLKARALAALVAGATYEEAATQVGRSVRAVQRWHDEYVDDLKTRSRKARTTRRGRQQPELSADSATQSQPAVATELPDAVAETTPQPADDTVPVTP